jgi:hypothetical protein
MALYRHRIRVRADLLFDLDLSTPKPSESELLKHVVLKLNPAVDGDGGFDLCALPGGRVYPAWNSVDRELEPEEALDATDLRITDTAEVD